MTALNIYGCLQKRYKAKSYLERVISLFAFPLSLLFFNIRDFVGDDDPICVVSSSPSLLSSVPAIKWARKLKTKFIFEVRDLWPMSLVEISGISEKNPFVVFLKLIEKMSYRKADKVFSVLPASAEYMTKNGMDFNKFCYIPNGIDISEKEKHEILTGETCNSNKNEKFTIGYAGTIGVANNLSNLVGAARILKNQKNISFVFIGDGPEKKRIEEESEGLDNIAFIPPVPKNEINAVLKTLDVGYLGLKRGRMFEYGISPNKLFDYMLAGIPVILAVNTKNSIVERAECGIVIEPDKPEELAEKILELYGANKKHLERMGDSGKRYVLQNHRYREITGKFLSEINGVLR